MADTTLTSAELKASRMQTPKPAPSENPHILPRLSQQTRGITRRSILLGLVLSVVHACWVIYEELTLMHVGAPTLFTLVQTVIGTLFVLLVLNSFLKKVRPRWVFSPSEIMVVFTMMTNSVIVCGSKFLHYLFPTVLWPFYMPGQTGGEATSAHMPVFFAPRDPETADTPPHERKMRVVHGLKRPPARALAWAVDHADRADRRMRHGRQGVCAADVRGRQRRRRRHSERVAGGLIIHD